MVSVSCSSRWESWRRWFRLWRLIFGRPETTCKFRQFRVSPTHTHTHTHKTVCRNYTEFSYHPGHSLTCVVLGAVYALHLRFAAHIIMEVQLCGGLITPAYPCYNRFLCWCCLKPCLLSYSSSLVGRRELYLPSKQSVVGLSIPSRHSTLKNLSVVSLGWTWFATLHLLYIHVSYIYDK